MKIAYSHLPKRELPTEEAIAKCYYEMGNNLYNQEKNLDREALENFEKAFRFKPDIPGLAEMVCPMAFGQGKWQLTLDSAEEALRQEPNSTMVTKIRDIAKGKLLDE